MRRKRIASCALAAALALSLAAPALAAYPDVADDHWAVSYINDMTEKGIFKGVAQDNGPDLFKPDNLLTASEAVALCARISVETDLRQQIGEDRQEDIEDILGTKWVSKGQWKGEQYWFADEYATCLEAGILTYGELEELYDSGDLSKPVTKEDFAFYLVRAMQLGPMAENLATHSLDFTDKTQVAADRESYVYLLNMYGIVTGNESKEFQPKSNVNRAVASTMLSRVLDFMDKRGTSVELPEYTDYEWTAGTVTAVSEGDKGVILLSIQGLGDEKPQSFSLPATTPIYENNMKVESSIIKEGQYARICWEQNGVPSAVRLSKVKDSFTGDIISANANSLLLTVDGVTRSVELDRFTKVKAGASVGDRSIIDKDGGYDEAVVSVDDLGHVVSVEFFGGTRQEVGIVKSVTNLTSGGATILVNGFNGQSKKYSVAADASLTANNQAITSLGSSYVGCYISLRVSNEDGTVSAASIDKLTKYVQGAIKGSGTNKDDENTVTISDLSSGKATTYVVASGAAFSYDGVEIGFGDLKKDMFATVRLAGGEIEMVSAYPSSTEVVGVITGVEFPKGTTKEVISVRKADDSIASFDVDLTNPPDVERNGKSITVDMLRGGDEVKITVRYNEVTYIEATPQESNLSGTITGISIKTDGIVLDLQLDSGDTDSYTVGDGVTVTQNDQSVTIYALKLGYHVSLVTSGDEVTAIEVDRASSESTSLSGSVILADKTKRTVKIRTSNENIITVNVPSSATIQEASGSKVALSALTAGDELNIYGEYENDNTTFKANIIIRTSKAIQ